MVGWHHEKGQALGEANPMAEARGCSRLSNSQRLLVYQFSWSQVEISVKPYAPLNSLATKATIQGQSKAGNGW